MKKTSRLLALLLALVMVLTACGGKKKDDKKTDAGKEAGGAPAAEEKVIAEGVKGDLTVQAETEWMDYYKKAIERVKEKNPDANITIIEKKSFDNLEVIDATGAKNDDVPDVFALPADRIFGLVDSESLAAVNSPALVEKLGGWESQEKFDNDGLGGMFKQGDEYFAFPFNIETLITYMNTANAAAKNIDVEKPIELNAENYQTVLLPAFDAWFGVAAMNSAEIELLQKDGDKFASDMTLPWAELPAEKQAVFTALYEYWKANNEKGTQLFDDKAGWGYIDTEFAKGGNGVFRIGGPWEYGNIAEKAGEANLKVATLDRIQINGKPLKHWKGGWGLAINSRIEGDKDKMALAHAMIAEIVNPEHFEELFKATGKILENVGADKYNASGLSDAEKKTIEATLASYDVAVKRPLFTQYGSVWDSYKNAVLSWNSAKPESAEKAYELLNASFTAMMSQVGGAK